MGYLCSPSTLLSPSMSVHYRGRVILMLNEAPAWCTCGGPPSKREAVSRSEVAALGGNALTAEGQRGTHREQRAQASALARSIAELREDGWRLAIVHGNGPQIGALSIQQEE